MALPVAPPVAVALFVVALLAGVGITALGPGGVFVTIALYAVAAVPTATVAGTASATFVATGLLGTAVYVRSGELARSDGYVLAVLLSATGLAGALVGVRLNVLIPEELFGLLLGAFVSLTGVIVWYRLRWGTAVLFPLDVSEWRGKLLAAAIGFGIGVPGGLLGVGGPIIAVPVLVVLDVPLLVAVAAAQVQSVFIAGFATAGYLARDAVSLPLAVLVGIPQLIGVVAGWRVAHAVDERRLKLALAVVLVVCGAYVAA